jgi:hypothetical protein
LFSPDFLEWSVSTALPAGILPVAGSSRSEGTPLVKRPMFTWIPEDELYDHLGVEIDQRVTNAGDRTGDEKWNPVRSLARPKPSCIHVMERAPISLGI